jgi:ABC-type cobalamin/Fe3+-siderophores transport system ATPase subunit
VHRDTGTDKRLRVLIVGPAGAGKTTLLERLGDSAGGRVVWRDGWRVKFWVFRFSRNLALIYSLISQIPNL